VVHGERRTPVIRVLRQRAMVLFTCEYAEEAGRAAGAK
jgi:hypothetical protein